MIQQIKNRKIIPVMLLCMAIFNLLAQSCLAIEINQDYPRLANYFLKWKVSDEDAIELAKWDVIILGCQTQYFNPDAIEKIRELNPDVKILAYLATESLHATDKDLSPRNPIRKLYDKVESNNWWLRDSSGDKVSFWSGVYMINIVETDWSRYLAEFAKEEIMSTGLWDGVYYDNSFAYVNWINDGDIDLNGDGKAESCNQLNSSWQKAMNELFDKTRQNVGDEALIVINSSNLYLENLNGRLLEGFPYGYDSDWQTEMKLYQESQNIKNFDPIVSVNNTNTENSGNLEDYQRMRFGLTSTLLLDGYFSFDYGDRDHAQTWWYDEYDVNLDKPLGEFYNINSINQRLVEGVYRRDFSQGIVLVNSSQNGTRVKLEAEYEKINGTQDTTVNNGWRVTSVKLPAEDGLILLKSVQDIVDEVYINGAYLRVYDKTGDKVRSSFFAYDGDFSGGAYVAQKDLDGDGVVESVVSLKNEISIYRQGKLIKTIYPYTENYTGKVSFDLGDLNGDGKYEIVSGVASYGGPHVRIFNCDGNLIHPGFFAYSENFRGGVNISCGDLNGDGRDEIITGANNGGGPHVRIFDGNGKLAYPGFFAYDKNFRGGVNLASGDVDGDGTDEIIAGIGKGGDNQVRIFDGMGNLESQFTAFEGQIYNGVEVFTADLDGNKQNEILVKIPY